MSDDSDFAHKQAMQATQEQVRDAVKKANIRRGVLIYLWGNGKGKSSSGFGTLLRAVGHGQNAAIIQFIKGTWKTGEEAFFKDHPRVQHHIMGTGFTWDTQNKEKDKQAALSVWQDAERCLANPEINLVLLDELTYMFDFDYLDPQRCLQAIAKRPQQQNVIVTGRSHIDALADMADTVSEIREIKHAFNAGVKAQKGIEF